MLIDALQCGEFDRNVLETLKRGGYTCVTPTLGFWEGTLESMDALGLWRDMERENADLIRIVRKADDILACQADGKVGILLGYQNTNLLEDRIRYVELFADMGVRVLQLTYNNQNELGGSCYEDEDSGLTRFGREVVVEMARCGIVVDCSHVGDKTTLHAIEHSPKPIAVTHANAASIFPHKRNRSDAVLKALAQTGGVIGCAAYRNITPAEACASVRGFAEMVARTVEIAGVDHVGIGTDFSYNSNDKFREWMRKGRWTRSVQYGAGSAAAPGAVSKPDWLPAADRLADLADGLADVGFSAEEVGKIMGGNWLRLYRSVFG
ncbi:membrane dipeptidase [Aquamicrobium sp. LC103]|uniref:dipeptidase n=1 Tax=Aquamicrobium sp. LC103 TaxID=1120658 RepID=UPI00063EC485|nr:membrane dipeptidase [Aquamicrobium sp. LC103]TKT78216.1 peptidase M19 [Aquamicrobium sp. LC103]